MLRAFENEINFPTDQLLLCTSIKVSEFEQFEQTLTSDSFGKAEKNLNVIGLQSCVPVF